VSIHQGDVEPRRAASINKQAVINNMSSKIIHGKSKKGEEARQQETRRDETAVLK